MKFQPKPANDFPEFIETYFKRCQTVCPKIVACAGKWQFEDLIPGLSDFDTRLIASDDTTTVDWMRMSLAVGRVHTELAEERPGWARILEHLPGVNLTLSELCDPVFYYPEFRQWSFYHGDRQGIERVRVALEEAPWSLREELFHLKKFVTYFGPYQRGIDPAINLGAYENKYPLHSRLMHYFAPPVQAAVSLAQRQTRCGKLEALRIAQEIFPHPEVIDQVFDAVERHYELLDRYREPGLSELETVLERYLRDTYATLQEAVTLISVDPSDSREQLRAKVAAVTAEPTDSFFEGIRYCRFLKGRLLFYAKPIPWFETAWLIRNELGRIVNHFYLQPLASYGKARYGKTLKPDEVLDNLCGELLSPQECSGMKEFSEVAALPVPDGQEKSRAEQVALYLDNLLVCLEKLKADLRRVIGTSASLRGCLKTL